MGQLLDAALDYARKGWPVFPLHGVRADNRGKLVCACADGPACRRPGNHPKNADWSAAASTKEEVIREQWRQDPNANVGLILGSRSGVVSIDIRGNDRSLEPWLDVYQEHGPLPCPMIDSIDRVCMLLRAPQYSVIGRVAIAPELDLAGDGQWLALPPSKRPDGTESTWQDRALELPDLPPWLREKARPSGPRIQWMEADEILAPLEPRQWVCEALQLGPGRVPVLAGYGGTGKTINAQSIAVSVATGKNVFGDVSFRVNEVGRVYHLDYDQGSYDTRERYQALCNAEGHQLEDIAPKLRYKYRPPLNATTDNARDLFLYELEGSKLVIIDSLRGLIPGEDENDSQFAERLYMLGEVSEKLGTTILVLAHMAKTPRGNPRAVPIEQMIRGSSAIHAAAGAIYAMSVDAEGNRRVEMVKPSLGSRGRVVEPFYLTYQHIHIPGNDVGGLKVTCQTQEQVEAKKHVSAGEGYLKKIVSFIAQNPGTSKTEIKEHAGVKHSKAVAARDQAEREGYIRQEGKGFVVTDKGRKLVSNAAAEPDQSTEPEDELG